MDYAPQAQLIQLNLQIMNSTFHVTETLALTTELLGTLREIRLCNATFTPRYA